jgi:hypothetical protein
MWGKSHDSELMVFSKNTKLRTHLTEGMHARAQCWYTDLNS